MVAAPLAAATVTATTPKVTANAAARFLEQASWGPTPAAVAEVQNLGFDAWIAAQFAVPPSAIPDATVTVDKAGKTTSSLRNVQQAFFVNAVNGQDQLRQRVAFALAQIWVVSGVKLSADSIPPYLRLLAADAFTTYPQIMHDVTLSPAMGHYLDMVNNDKPSKTRGANENYAREVLQLFTIGLSKLDQYGNPVLVKGQPVPSYTQDTVEGFARTFTGWTYAPPAGVASKWTNPSNFTAPMVAVEAHHDTTPKTLLGGETICPGGGCTAEADLKAALDNIARDENLAPFISRQLIQHLVMSSPSNDYVQDVAAIFTSTHGDMKEVVKAILLDDEARRGDDTGVPQAGHLKEPVLFINGLLRGLQAKVDGTNTLVDFGSRLGQNIYNPPTVFNYFPPNYQINIAKGTTSSTYNAPEFALLSEATAMMRADFLNSLAFGKITGVTLDLTRYSAPLTATPPGDPSKMIDALNTDLMGGRMSSSMHDIILAAVNKATTPAAKVETAVYLIGSSWEYQVQR